MKKNSGFNAKPLVKKNYLRRKNDKN